MCADNHQKPEKSKLAMTILFLGSVPRLVVGDSWDQYDFTFQMQLNSTIDQLKNDQTFLLHIRFTLKSDCSSRGNYVLYRDKNFFDTAGLRI